MFYWIYWLSKEKYFENLIILFICISLSLFEKGKRWAKNLRRGLRVCKWRPKNRVSFLLLLSLPLQQQCKNIERKEGGKTSFTGDA